MLFNKNLRRCEGLNGSRLESTQVQERQHGLRVSRTGRRFLVTLISLSAQQVNGGKRMHVVDCDDWGSNIRVRGVQALVCKPLLSVGEYTSMGGVTVLYCDKGYMFHKGSNVAKKIGVWIQKGVERFSIPRLHSCVQRKQRVQHLHENREETRLMRCHCLEILNRGVPGRVRTCKTGECRSRSSRRRRSARSNAR